jgi:hypothetical protein
MATGLGRLGWPLGGSQRHVPGLLFWMNQLRCIIRPSRAFHSGEIITNEQAQQNT